MRGRVHLDTDAVSSSARRRGASARIDRIQSSRCTWCQAARSPARQARRRATRHHRAHEVHRPLAPPRRVSPRRFDECSAHVRDGRRARDSQILETQRRPHDRGLRANPSAIPPRRLPTTARLEGSTRSRGLRLRSAARCSSLGAAGSMFGARRYSTDTTVTLTRGREPPAPAHVYRSHGDATPWMYSPAARTAHVLYRRFARSPLTAARAAHGLDTQAGDVSRGQRGPRIGHVSGPLRCRHHRASSAAPRTGQSGSKAYDMPRSVIVYLRALGGVRLWG